MALVVGTNSYVTVAEADDYFETRIDSANWTTSSTAVKEQALVTASLLLDDQAWIGYAVSSSQALAWPRESAYYYDARLGQYITIANDETPAVLKRAVYEQALHLVDNEDVIEGGVQTFESITVGPISLTDSNNDVRRKSLLPARITNLITPLLIRGGTSWWRAN